MPKKSAKRTAKKAVKKIAKKTVKKTVKKTANPTGAGRPKGSGMYGCETKSVRVPAHLAEAVRAFAKKQIKAGK